MRDLGRVHQIASVLVRYGFGDLVRRIGMANALERAGRALHWRTPEDLAHMEPPARARRALEELGPTFVKLGQILATRVDLFGPEWIAEFGKLQDAAPTVAFEELQSQLCEDLGAPPEEVFAEFVREPLGAASLAQVYRARTHEGRPVVVKVRRPNIRPAVEADLRLLAHLAEILEAEAPELHRYRPRDVVRQFTISLRFELDFAAEGRNAERIAGNFRGHEEIVIPGIYWGWTGERLNVQDYIEGVPGRDFAAADAAGLDRKRLAQRGANAVLKMMLEDGLFHADPHPGNVFYLPGDRIAFIDFGMVGRLSEERRFELARVLHGAVKRESRVVVDVLLEWGGFDGETADRESLTSEIDALIDRYHGVPLKRLNISTMLSDLVGILRDHGIALPSDLALLIKAFITLEGFGRQLDPDFDMAGELAPFVERMMVAQSDPRVLAQRGWGALTSTLELLAGLPHDLRRILQSASQGKLQLQVEISALRNFGDRMDRALARLAIAIVTAALIMGTATVMTVERAPALLGLPSLGLLGFLAAVVGGIWVLVSVRRGRRD